VNRRLKQFEDMKKMMKAFSSGKGNKMLRGMGGMRGPMM
jgi:signal recognition particle GTPase